jgi:beta-lactamase regulating signal transducer with metallopeptidase domain
MIAAWIVYALVVGTLVALAARAMESVARLAGRPARWVWAGALALGAGLTALAPWRSPATTDGDVPRLQLAAKIADGVAAPDARDRFLAVLRAPRTALASAMRDALVAAERRTPPWIDRAAAVAWPAGSALLLALLVVVHHRFRRQRRAWPVAELRGVRVRLSPGTGPAVVGLLRPEIVVPRWLLQRSPEEQRLVLEHEREHVRAGDGLLLAAGWAMAALLPWHPATWWMLSRLRLSVELDCDARVLRRGAAPRPYGALLIEIAGLAGRRSGMRIGAPALADESSHLERRLIAMTPRRARFAHARAISLAALAFAALLTACESALPTATDIERMDAASATESAVRMKVLAPGDSLPTFVIDGVVATALQAHALTPEEIASVDVVRGDVRGEIRITTRAAAEAAGIEVPVEGVRLRSRSNPLVAPDTAAAGESRHRIFPGLIFIDGVRADPAAMHALDPDAIESVEVLKGSLATQRYTELEAVNGVILVTTKR